MPGLLEERIPSGESQATASSTQQLPKGIVLDKDGKPCRTCTSSSAWLSMMKQSTSKNSSTSNKTPFSNFTTAATASAPATVIAAAATATTSSSDDDQPQPPSDCPPDVEVLGNSTWTLLHSLTANYPEHPTAQQTSDVSQFLHLFAKLYPCWVCADDFRDWMRVRGNEPRLSNQEEFGRWMCRAHNAVNVKLGKKEFDCDLWRERWKDGWKDGRCG